MIYPQAPWNLQGYGFQTLQLLDVERVRPLVPFSLDIVSVLPGKTLGGVYVAHYGTGSTLIYNELIVVNAIVHHAGRVGSWISHIYVDQPDSVAGGREIWGLPKELAQFTWETENRLSVWAKQDGQLLCTLNCNWKLPGWQQALPIPTFSQRAADLITFEGQGTFKWHLAGLDLHVPPTSHFAWLGIGQTWLNFYLDPLHLVAKVPYVVEEKVAV